MHKTLLYASLIISVFATSAFAKDNFPQPAYVSLKLANKVIKFPGDKPWDGGPNMLYTALSPNQKILLVTSPSTASVHAFDTKSGKSLAVVACDKGAKGVKISPNGKEAYISNEGANSISVVDLKTFKVTGTIATEKMPHNVRFNDNGSMAYVTLQGGAGLGVIDTKSKKVTKVIPIPGLEGPHNLDLSADGKTAFVRDTGNKVAAVELSSGKVKKIIEVGKGHAGIDVSADGKYVITGAIADEVVTVIDAKTLKVVKTIKVGSGPHGVRTSKNSRWLYVAVTAADSVVVIDTKDWSIANTIKTGSFPFWVAVHGNS